MLWSICSYKGGLPIGAPTSPFIANRIMKNTDKKLKRISLFIKYTRYADDLIFSSEKRLDKKLITKIADILKKAGFCLNYKKTYFMNSRRQVTGVILTDKNKLSLGTTYKKKLKKDIYNLLINNKGKKDCVSGKLSYLNFVEPSYAQIIKDKYIKFDTIGFFN
jgi:hypothetical protein